MIKIDRNNKLNLSGLHPAQQDFVRSNKLHTVIIGGNQSGKSTCGIVKTLTKLLRYPGVPCAYYLPTYDLIATMLVPKFKDLFEAVETPYVYNEKKSKFTSKYGEILMRSMFEPDRIVAYSVGNSIVDEPDVVPRKKMDIAYGRIVARNSYKTTGQNSIDFLGSPEGYGFLYDFIEKKFNNNKLHLKLSTLDNLKNLGEGYEDGMREAYTNKQLEAYFHGNFVNINTGTVYYGFDRKKSHSNRLIKPNEVLHIGMDFNITNMNAVIHVIDGWPIAVAEITGAFDTRDICNKIKQQYPGHSIVVYPDASSSKRNTSGGVDKEIIKSYAFTVRAPRQNPFVKDRVNVMNTAFLNAKGQRNYFINTDNCPVYTEALELQTYRNGEPDKTSGYDHITEAGGYFIWGNQKKKTYSIYAT